jgi:hypothetical protein
MGPQSNVLTRGPPQVVQRPNFLSFKEPKDRFQGTNSATLLAWRAGTTTLFLLGS